MREKASFDILKKINEEKEKRNWTEYELAQNCGLTQSTISTWYRRNLQPSVSSIERICAGLGISLSEFFNESDEQTILTPEEADVLDLFQKLSPEQRKTTLAMIRSYIQK